jgi:hypothetical protein
VALLLERSVSSVVVVAVPVSVSLSPAGAETKRVTAIPAAPTVPSWQVSVAASQVS